MSQKILTFLCVFGLTLSSQALAADDPPGEPDNPGQSPDDPGRDAPNESEQQISRPASIFVQSEYTSEKDPTATITISAAMTTNGVEYASAARYLEDQVQELKEENPNARIEGLSTYTFEDLGYVVLPGNNVARQELQAMGLSIDDFASANNIRLESNTGLITDGVVDPAMEQILGGDRPVFKVIMPSALPPPDGAVNSGFINTKEPEKLIAESELPPVDGAAEAALLKDKVAEVVKTMPSGEVNQARMFVWVRFAVAGVTEAALILTASGIGPQTLAEGFGSGLSSLTPETIARMTDISMPWVAASFAFFTLSEVGFQVFTNNFRTWLRKSPTIYGQGVRRLFLTALVVGAHQYLLVNANLINMDLSHAVLFTTFGTAATHTFYSLFAQDNPPRFLRGARAIFSLAMVGNFGILLSTFGNSLGDAGVIVGYSYLSAVLLTGHSVFFGSGGGQLLMRDTKLLMNAVRDKFSSFGSICREQGRKVMGSLIRLGKYLQTTVVDNHQAPSDKTLVGY